MCQERSQWLAQQAGGVGELGGGMEVGGGVSQDPWNMSTGLQPGSTRANQDEIESETRRA